MSFSVFEAAVSSDQEVGLAKQASVDAKEAAIYDVREKLGPTLFAARNLEQFRDTVAMMKTDQSVYKIISAHIFPGASVVRQIVGRGGVLEKEFKAKLADMQPPSVPNSAAGLSPTPPAASGMLPAAGAGQNNMLGSPGGPGAENAFSDIAPGSGENDMLGSPGGPGTTARRRAAEKSRPELKPDGNFKSYLKKVDQGARSKVDKNCFTGEGTEHIEDPAKHNFASREMFAVYRDWCVANDCSPARLSSLDAYADRLPDSDYMRLASMIQAWDNDHKPKIPNTNLKKTDKVAGSHGTGVEHAPPADYIGDHRGQFDSPHDDRVLQGIGGPGTDEWIDFGRHEGAMGRYTRWAKHNGLKALSARNIAYYSQNDPEMAYVLAYRARTALRTAASRKGYSLRGAGEHGLEVGSPSTNPYTGEEDMPGNKRWDDTVGHPVGYGKHRPDHVAGRRTAAPDYLQKADDALTQLLNQKAQEFQETIQPLQQALVTVQQATQLQQAQNPMNVLPPPGTVNVMPGGDQGPAGMPAPGAQDLGAAVQALAGGADASAPGPAGAGGSPAGGTPDDQSGPPPAAAGGGLPPGLDGQVPPQTTARRRQANDVHSLWEHYQSQRAQSGNLGVGGDADYQDFASKYNVGPRALQNLKKNHLGDQSPGVVARRRYAEDDDDYGSEHSLDWDPDKHKVDRDKYPKEKTPQGGGRRSSLGKGRGAARPLQGGQTKQAWPGKKKPQQPQKQQQPAAEEAYDPLGGHKVMPHASGQGYAVQNPKGQWLTSPWEPDGAARSPEMAHNFNGIDEAVGAAQGQWPQSSPPHHSVSESYDGPSAHGFGWHDNGWRPEFPQPEGSVGVENKHWEPYPGRYVDNAPSQALPSGRGSQPNIQPGQREPEKVMASRQKYLKWCKVNRLKAANNKNLYWYAAQVAPKEQRALLANGEHDFDPRRDDQIFAPDRGHGWSHDSGPSGPPYVRDQANGPHRHEAQRKKAWSGWGPAQVTKTREVTGWNWDNHLNGYTANKPQHFACECGDQFPTPSGFQRCACGRQWNSYVIGTGGSNREASAEKFLVREIPVRPDVIVANRKMAGAGRTACYPGCEKNEAHAKKFHKKAWGAPGRHENPDQEIIDMNKAPTHATGELVSGPGISVMKKKPGAPVGEPRHQATVLMDPRTGKLHKLIDPGEVGDGGEEGPSTAMDSRSFKPGWAKRNSDGKYLGPAVGK